MDNNTKPTQPQPEDAQDMDEVIVEDVTPAETDDVQVDQPVEDDSTEAVDLEEAIKPSTEGIEEAPTTEDGKLEEVDLGDETPEEDDEEEKPERVPFEAAGSLNIIGLENMINSYMGDLEKVQDQIKAQNQMLKDALENDAEYMELQKKATDINKAKKTVKDKLVKDPALSVVQQKIDELKFEIKDIRDAISGYVEQYYEQSGLRQITGADGEIHEIITSVKLVKKRV
ncbi:MAG: hypothetical protein ACEQSA_03855 [Weeksellaceae bacterium]